MPFNWTTERERLMLLITMCHLNSKPTNETWETVARTLGEGLTSSAVSQKYYKMKKDAVELCNTNTILTPPATPTKRKAVNSPSKIVKSSSRTKRAKRFNPEDVDLDGEGWSSFGSFHEQLGLTFFPENNMSFVGEQHPRTGNESFSIDEREGVVEDHWSFPHQE